MEDFSNLDNRISMEIEGVWLDYDGTPFFHYWHTLFLYEAYGVVKNMKFHICTAYGMRNSNNFHFLP